jgi:hypothetical protein
MKKTSFKTPLPFHISIQIWAYLLMLVIIIFLIPVYIAFMRNGHPVRENVSTVYMHYLHCCLVEMDCQKTFN